jgi:hypothetical protein
MRGCPGPPEGAGQGRRLGSAKGGGSAYPAIAFRPASVICIQTMVLIRPLMSTRLRCMTAYP